MVLIVNIFSNIDNFSFLTSSITIKLESHVWFSAWMNINQSTQSIAIKSTMNRGRKKKKKLQWFEHFSSKHSKLCYVIHHVMTLRKRKNLFLNVSNVRTQKIENQFPCHLEFSNVEAIISCSTPGSSVDNQMMEQPQQCLCGYNGEWTILSLP